MDLASHMDISRTLLMIAIGPVSFDLFRRRFEIIESFCRVKTNGPSQDTGVLNKGRLDLPIQLVVILILRLTTLAMDGRG